MVYTNIPTYLLVGGSSYINLPADTSAKHIIIHHQPPKYRPAMFQMGDTRKNTSLRIINIVLETILYVYRKQNTVSPDSIFQHLYLTLQFSKKTILEQLLIFVQWKRQNLINILNILFTYPLKVAEKEKLNYFDLLLITNGENSHYTYISNFSRLVQTRKTKHTEKIFIYKRCFTSFNDVLKNFKLCGQ